MSIDAAETELGGLLSLTSGLEISNVPTGNIRILQHFQTFTSLTLGGSSCQAIFHSVISQKAWEKENQSLMHMVLAVSCAHLKRLHTEPSQVRLYQQYSIAEAAHWQTGLQLYQKLLKGNSAGFSSKPNAEERSPAFVLTPDSDSGLSEKSTGPQPNDTIIKPDFDATLATTFLTIIFTFALDDDIPLDAYTDSDQEKFRHAINPLAATGGFRALRGM